MQATHPPRAGTSRFVVAVAFALVLVPTLGRASLPEDGLTSFELRLLGLSAHPEPETQVVPRNTPTGLHIALEFGSSAVDPESVLSLLPTGLEIAAELVGPGIATPIQLRGQPGALLPIPPLVERGMYLVRDIRLELDGEFFLRAYPDAANIQVIERVIVTQVTTRPLDAEEIRQRGIIFGDDNFKAYDFTLALKLDSKPVRIDFPVVFDSNHIPVPTRGTARLSMHGEGGGNPLGNAQFQPLVLNLSLPDVAELDLPEELPEISIPGLLVIPGDIGFLNQFFSAILVVSNAAPLGSGLSVRDLEAAILLPAGDDDVSGTVDDPLVVAETGSGAALTLPVVGLGGDGVVATGDDTTRFRPGEQGQAEFLLEGRKEGFHEIEFDITGVLEGLPVGPVDITGTARGGVVVRNPFFNVTFSAPRTVRRFEEFTLFVNVTNTSESVANYVNVTLNALQLSGAELLSSSTLTIDTLSPGDSETLRYRFRSLQTGEVTASYLNFESAGTENEGDLMFTLGVDERGTPLSPDTLVLPASVEALPTGVVDQATRVLGQAWSLATAPDGTVPDGVLRVSKQAAIDRAIELAEAGLRVQLGESLDASLSSLAFTWLATGDPGFDQLLRETDAGESFLRELGQEIGTTDPLSVVHESLSSRLTSSAPHVQVSVGDGAGSAPVTWELEDGGGRALRVEGAPGSQDLFSSTLPSSGFLSLTDPVDAGRGTALVAALGASVYEFRWTATAAGNLDLSISLPRADGSVGVHAFDGVAVSAGHAGKVVLDLVTPAASLAMSIDTDGDGVFDVSVDAAPEQVLSPSGPQLLTATVVGPETISGADSFGRAAVLLFDRELDPDYGDIEDNYVLEEHDVLSARTQLSGRLVFLFLGQPAGDLVERELTVSGIQDPTGRVMTPQTVALGSRMVPPDAVGGIVSGRVLDAEGAPIEMQRVEQETGDELLVTASFYDANGNLRRTEDAEGRATDFLYDGLNRLRRVDWPLSLVTLYDYDGEGSKTQETNRRNVVTDFEYDNLGRLTRTEVQGTITGVGAVTSVTYVDSERKRIETDARGNPTTFEMDEQGRVVKIGDALTHERSFEYDGVNKTAEVDERLNRTEYEYDGLNRLTKVIDALSQEITTVYDDGARTVTETDRRNLVKTTELDALGRLVSVTRSGVLLEQHQYDGNDNRTLSTDANGNETQFTYDGANRLTARTDAFGTALATTSTFLYDRVGNLLEEKDGRITGQPFDVRNGYDDLNRVVSTEDALGNVTRFEYDGEGNRTAKVDPKSVSHRTELDHGELNELVEVRMADGGVYQYGYDANRNRTSQTDAEGNDVTFTYDALNRVDLMTQDPTGFAYITDHDYDPSGNEIKLTDPKDQVVDFEYDELNRLKKKIYNLTAGDFELYTRTHQIDYHYDPNDNVTRIDEWKSTGTDPPALVSSYKTYDALDRLTSETDAWARPLGYGYDNQGNRTLLEDPDGKRTVYGFDELNRLETITLDEGTPSAEVVTYSYLPNGLKDRVVNPNGTMSTYGYDIASRMTSITHTGPTGIVSAYQYTYDANGNRTQQIETNAGTTQTTLYDYDLTDRLTVVTYEAGTVDASQVAYTYDLVGNRLTEQAVTLDTSTVTKDLSYLYDAINRLDSIDDLIGTDDVAYTSDELDQQFEDLRELDVMSKKGRWSKCTLVVGSDGQLKTDFSYDESPGI